MSKNEQMDNDAMLVGMIHDLRNQLQLIQNVSQVLADEPAASVDQKKWITALHQASMLATRQVNALLSSSASKNYSSEERYFKLRDVVNMVGKGLEPMAIDKGVDFRTNVNDDVPQVLWGDSLYLSQILLNLIRNALEYASNKGEVSLSVSQQAHTEYSHELVFEIADNGPGLPEEVSENLGKPYLGTHSVKGGMGLGLYMVKKWVEMMGGKMETRANQPEGLAIKLSIPFANLKSNNIDGTSDSTFRNFSILIVEDNKLNLQAMSKIIRKNFPTASVFVAENIEEAGKKISEIEKLDVALIDIYLGHTQSGQSIAERVRAYQPKSTIVAISAMPMANTRPPFNYFLSKPVSPEELTGFLANLKL